MNKADFSSYMAENESEFLCNYSLDCEVQSIMCMIFTFSILDLVLTTGLH